jgi:CRP-like cAMP-binding protein
MTAKIKRLRNNGSPLIREKAYRGPVRNLLLRALPGEELETVLSKAELVDVPVQSVLNEKAETIEYCYFIDDGLASILNIMSDGKSVEVGLAGKEGFVGLPLLVDFHTSPTRAIMQIGGTAFKMKAEDVPVVLRACPVLEKSLQQYSHVMALQVTYVAACNRLHEVDARLARWLLMSEDRMGSPNFPLTQQFLAHMLGTRRASVTVAAGILQKAGLITYKRGQVTIRNRAKLEKAACECYGQLNRQMQHWAHPSPQASLSAAN